MTRDIRDLLHGAAPDPTGPPDLDWIRRRGRTLVATRVAGIASVVVLALAGVVGLAAQLVADDDQVPPVIDEPTPDPDEAEACSAPPFRPTYLPWLEEGERVPEPDMQGIQGTDAILTWQADADDPDPAPSVSLAAVSVPEREPGTGDWSTVEVRGYEADLVWTGDPGVGGMSLSWRERPDPCGVYNIVFMTGGIGPYLDLEGRPSIDEIPDEEIDDWMLEFRRAIEDEAGRFASSLAAVDELAMTCAEGGSFPDIAQDEVWVFFYCDDPYAYPGGLYATVRDVPPGSEQLAVAMAALAAGPTDEERADGFRSTLADMGDIRVLEASVTGDGTIAVIDLTGLPDELTWNQRTFGPPGFIEEVAWTVFQNDFGVDAIELRLDGSCDAFWELVAGEGCSLYTLNQWAHIPEE